MSNRIYKTKKQVERVVYGAPLPIPEGMVRPDAIHPATPMVSRAEICGKLLKLEHVEKVWVYAADGRLARHSAASPQSLPLDGLASGVYVVRMQCGSIIRSQQLILP